IGSAYNQVIGGNLDKNGFYGIEVSQSRRNRIIGNSASGNGSDDLYDSTLGCDSNQWFGNSFTTANGGCIH
ncbi:MAG TPA: hypothetical protein VJ718_01500, partial [Candidatus Binataceae bacterium]|nr:hypothetical protein [Candidatus Binataceae bacterium]